MHFVYKTHNLSRSIRVWDENSSVTKGFHYFELIWTPDSLCVQNAPFKATSSFFDPLWLHLLFFMHLLIILSYKTVKLKITTKWTLKMLKLGMVSSFHPHSMCERVERVTKKLDALRVQTGQTLSEYQGFGRELICYTGTSMFFKLIWTPDLFCVQYAAFKATSSISNMF